MHHLPLELIDIIFSQVPIKMCRLINKQINILTDIRFINSIVVTKNDKATYIKNGNPIFIYDYLDYKWRFYNDGKLKYENIGNGGNPIKLDNIDMYSIYTILKNKDYHLPKDFAKNKMLSMLNNTILPLYIKDSNICQRQDKEFYYCWLVTNAVSMGLMDIEYLKDISGDHLNITTEQNKQLFNKLKEYILTLE